MTASSDQFRLAISAFVAKAKGNADSVTRKVVIDVATRLVERSPVGNRELWAINDLTAALRETEQVFREQSGKKRFTERTSAKHFPTKGPKGYVGGRFRASWQLGEGSPSSGEPYAEGEASYPDPQAVIASIDAAITNNPAGRVFFICNNLAYAQRLELGWSRQAPNGMVALTVVEFENIVDAAASEVNK